MRVEILIAVITLHGLSTVVGQNADSVVLSLPAPDSDGMIPLGGKTKSGVGYTISSFSTTFWNAIDYCKNTGRKLVAIDSAEEQRELSLFLTSYGLEHDYIWTSGVELTQGCLIWASTGLHMIYSNIGNSHNGDNLCLAIYGRNPLKYKWLFSYCNSNYPFICEY